MANTVLPLAAMPANKRDLAMSQLVEVGGDEKYKLLKSCISKHTKSVIAVDAKVEAAMVTDRSNAIVKCRKECTVLTNTLEDPLCLLEAYDTAWQKAKDTFDTIKHAGLHKEDTQVATELTELETLLFNTMTPVARADRLTRWFDSSPRRIRYLTVFVKSLPPISKRKTVRTSPLRLR